MSRKVCVLSEEFCARGTTWNGRQLGSGLPTSWRVAQTGCPLLGGVPCRAGCEGGALLDCVPARHPQRCPQRVWLKAAGWISTVTAEFGAYFIGDPVDP